MPQCGTIRRAVHLFGVLGFGGRPMKLVHSRSDPDLYYLVRAPLEFWDLEKKLHWIEEWAPDQAKRPSSIEPGKRVKGLLAIDFQGFVVECKAELVPTSDPDVMTFEGMGERGEELIRVFYRGIMSGRMSSAEGVINSIDIPVDDVSMQPTEDELTSKKSLPRIVRAGASSLMYLLLAGAVFGSIGYTVWSRNNFVSLEGTRLVLAAQEGQAGVSSLSGDPTLAIQGRLPEDRLLHVHEGMAGLARLNFDGDVKEAPVQLSRVVAGDLEIVVTLALDKDAQSLLSADPGTPVDVKLDRELGLFGLIPALAQ